MYRKKRILPMALFTSVVSLMACGVCNADSDTVAGRIAELAALQAENSSLNFNPNNTVAFPGTFQDLSQQERMDIYTQSYKPFFNRDAYRPINIKDDTAERKSRDCSKVYACIENYGKAEKEAEDAYYRDMIAWMNAYYFETSAKEVTARKKFNDSAEQLGIALASAIMAPCVCVKDLDFADDILKDLNMSCDEYFKEQAEQEINTYVDSITEELLRVNEEWTEANKDLKYNDHNDTVPPAPVAPDDTIPSSMFSKSIPSGEVSPDGFHQKDNCKQETEDSTNNHYLYPPDQPTKPYEADENACNEQTRIFILGKSKVSGKSYENYCWESDTQDEEEWCHDGIIADESTPHTDCQFGQTCPALAGVGWCHFDKWTANSSGKIPVLVNADGKIISSTDGILLKSLIHDTQDPIAAYHVHCIGYVCPVWSGGSIVKYRYGCSDGSCTPGCPMDIPPAPKLPDEAEPWTMPTKHKDTVKPYLDVLSKCKGSK